MKFLTMIAVFSLLAGCSNQVDHTLHPRIDSVAPFYSARVMPRTVEIWLPRQYQSSLQQHFPVLYMHDGQNLFNHSDATLGIAWDVDRVAQRLMDQQKIKPAIIVAIWNTPMRQQEYFPGRALNFSGEIGDASNDMANDYVQFIVRELKPYIDRHYRTAPDKANTFIAGGGMGALISLYAFTEYPDVFGGAACITNQAQGLLGQIDSVQAQNIKRYMEIKLPAAGAHRLFFALGTDHTHQMYNPYSLGNLLQVKGYEQGRNWLITTAPGVEYDENIWRMRADNMLAFLLGEPFSTPKSNQ